MPKIYYGDNGFYVQVRLQGGSKLNEGFIEIKPSNGTWGGICDDAFNKPEADVICRMVGYSHGSEKAWNGWTRNGWTGNVIQGHQFGHGSGGILLDNISCNGNEDSILECTDLDHDHLRWGVHDCRDAGTTHEWAGVTCKV